MEAAVLGSILSTRLEQKFDVLTSKQLGTYLASAILTPTNISKWEGDETMLVELLDEALRLLGGILYIPSAVTELYRGTYSSTITADELVLCAEYATRLYHHPEIHALSPSQLADAILDYTRHRHNTDYVSPHIFYPIVVSRLTATPVITTKKFTVSKATYNTTSREQYAPTLREQYAPTLREQYAPTLRELAILGHLSSECIVKPRPFFDELQLYYGIEYDTTLSHIASTLTPATQDAVRQELIAAVAHCHTQCVIHRNLQPSSIVFAGTQLKLSGFSDAVIVHHRLDRRSLDVVGNFYYREPALLDSTIATYGMEVDDWALGVILLELELGYHPFHTAVDVTTQRDHIRKFCAITLPNVIENPVMLDVLRRLLAEDPLTRFPAQHLSSLLDK